MADLTPEAQRRRSGLWLTFYGTLTLGLIARLSVTMAGGDHFGTIYFLALLAYNLHQSINHFGGYLGAERG